MSTTNRNHSTHSTVHKAAFRGDTARLRAIIGAHPETINAKDANGATPLHHAAFKGNIEVLQFLLEHGADCDAEDKDKCTPLHNAAFTDKLNCATALVVGGSNVDHEDVDKATPLHKAVFNGNISIAKLLIEKKCNINHQDSDGITAVQKATYNDHSKCLTLLLDNKADVNIADSKGSTGLHKAAFNGFQQCVEILIARGIDVNAKDNEDATALHNAVYNGHTEVVNTLLVNGARPNCSTSKYKSTPLHFAAFNGYLDCIKLLLEWGGSIDLVDAKGMTPLHYAVKRNHEDCVEFLLQRGANVNASDLKRRTWKEFASSKTIISMLNQRDENGGTKKSESNGESENASGSETPPGSNNILGQPRPHRSESRSSVSSRRSSSSSKPSSRSEEATPTPVSPNNKHHRKSHSRNLSKSETSSPAVNNISEPVPEKSAMANHTEKAQPISQSLPNSSSHLSINHAAERSGVADEVYGKLDRNGFLVTEEEKNRAESLATDNADKDMQRSIKWMKMIKKWDETVKKDNKKIKTRCEKGIPARVRGQAWKLLARSTTEQHPARATVNYANLLQQDSEHLTQIQKDINRTFPQNIFLMEKGGQEVLMHVLKAFAVHRPDVGYCQGMGFVTALLLMYMGEEDAFWVLERLASIYDLADLWKGPALPGLSKCFYIMENLMPVYVPKIYQHLQAEGVTLYLFATQWFLTLFLYNFPFSIVLRIWDIFLFEGYHFIFAVALALFKVHEETILTRKFEDLVMFLKFNHQKSGGNELDLEQIIKTTNALKEKVKRSLKTILADYQKAEKDELGRIIEQLPLTRL